MGTKVPRVSMSAFDVFLSYSHADQEAVERLGRALRDRGLTVFVDRWYLVAGQSWPEALEKHLRDCRAVAVCIGAGEMGEWQKREHYKALDRQAHEPGFPVIPVLLPGAEDPALGFLGLNTWIDLRRGIDDKANFEFLARAARGLPPGDAAALVPDPRAAICPYRGLLPFREEDAPFFIGREAFTRALIDKVRTNSLVAVVGASGSGKSSVVRAGLVPALRRGADDHVWAILAITPGPTPLHALLAVLSPPADELSRAARLAHIEGDVALLRERGLTIAAFARDILREQPGTDRFLLVVDQWEELYAQTKSVEDRRRFLDLILEATTDGPVSVVLTLRGDFYGRALEDRAFADRLQNAVVNLGPMHREELRRAVTEPAAKVGLGFEDGLIDRILEEVGSEPGNLPLLEFLLTELWARRERGCLTHAAYAAIGGVKGAIATRAEAELKRLTAEEREALRRVMIRLVTPGEGRADTRAIAEIPVGDAAAEVVVRRFADARLLTTGRDEASGHETVEVSHEALIREWGTYRGWVDTDREFLRTVERVKDAMRAWAEEKADKDSRLLAPGRPLEEARELLSRQDALIDDIRPYIEASIAKDDARLAEEQGRLQRELATAQRLASKTHLANWYAEQAIDITLRFVKQAVELSDSFHIPRSAIEVLLTGADAAFKKLMQDGKSSPHELHDRQGYDVASQLRSARAQLLMSLADHYRIIGDVKQQHEKAKQACDMLKELVTEYPSNPEWLEQLACGHDLVGDALANQLQLGAALADYRASRSIREKLWKDNPSDPHLQWVLSISDIKIGDVNYELGHLEEALDAFDSARKCADPANRDWQRDLLVIDHRIGDVLTKQGDLNGAGKSYQTSLDIAEQLAAADPSNIQPQCDLAVSHERIGNNLEDQGDIEAALAAYQASLSITERLAADDPKKVPIQSDLSLGYENVGRILLKQHQIDAALDALRASLVIAERLAADHADSSLQRDLSIRLNNMGDALKEQGDLQTALDYYQRSLAIRKKLAAADPSNTELQRHVLHSHKRIGDILHEQGQFQEEIGEYQAYI